MRHATMSPSDLAEKRWSDRVRPGVPMTLLRERPEATFAIEGNIAPIAVQDDLCARRERSTPAVLRQGFEHSPITSVADVRRAPPYPNSAPTQTFTPHFPRSAGQEGFEHSPITSTDVEITTFPWSRAIFALSPRTLGKCRCSNPPVTWENVHISPFERVNLRAHRFGMRPQDHPGVG